MNGSNTSGTTSDAGSIEAWLDDHGLRLTATTDDGDPLDLGRLEHGRGTAAMLRHADGTPIAELVVLRIETMTHTEAIRRAPQAAADRTLLLLGPHVSGRGASALRAAGIHHLDGTGNAWIRLPGVVVDVRGKAPAEPRARMAAPGQVNLLSTSRSQVVFALISWPELAPGPIRTLAASARVSVGLAQETMKLLEAQGHMRTWPERGLERVPDLIDRWVAAFPAGLGAPARTRSYHAEDLQVRATETGVVRLSGEAAAPGLRGVSAVVYTDDASPRLALRNRWRTDREPNVLVRAMFWTDPRQDDDPTEVRDAPPLLVYADLMASGESRQREAAAELRKVDGGLRAR